jgi:hypothetical protein
VAPHSSRSSSSRSAHPRAPPRGTSPPTASTGCPAALNRDGVLTAGEEAEKNDIFANVNCGVQNGSTGGGIDYVGVSGLDATNNFWGAATGPGADPADDTCSVGVGASVTVTPFATKAFSIKAPIKP